MGTTRPSRVQAFLEPLGEGRVRRRVASVDLFLGRPHLTKQDELTCAVRLLNENRYVRPKLGYALHVTAGMAARSWLPEG